MYIMILSIMYYFTNFGDLCDSGSFHLYGFPGSTTHYDKKFILLLLTSYISEIKLFLFLFLLFLYINSQHNVLYYRLVKIKVCVTSCYELEMLDEHTASGSLFNLLICNRTTQPAPPPPHSE